MQPKNEIQPIIQLQQLRKSIWMDNEERVILDLQLPEALKIYAGDFIFVTGDSGCGKTTLLSILGLLDFDYQADLSIILGQHQLQCAQQSAAERRTQSQQARKHMSYIFQDIRVQLDRDAISNVEVPLRYKGVIPEARRQAASKALTDLDIEAKDHKRRVSAFSGGMQQRVGIARALANQPQIIFADEPTAHLDMSISQQIYESLHKMCKQQKITVIVVSHDTDQVLPYADVTIAMQAYDESSKRQVVKVEDRRSPEARQEPSNNGQKATNSALINEMFREARQEFKPMLQAFGFWAGGFLKARSKAPPAHLYLSTIAAFITCSLLFACAFFFQVFLEGTLSFQDDFINSLQFFREVRVERPAHSDNELKELNLDALQSYTQQKNISIETMEKQYDLYGLAVLEHDLTEKYGLSATVRNKLLRLSIQQKSLPKNSGTEQQRMTIKLIAMDEHDDLAKDYGIFGTPFAAGTQETVPEVYIRQSHLWKNYGSFPEIPQAGDKLHIMFWSEPFVQSTAQQQKAYLCLEFAVKGNATRSNPRLFQLLAESVPEHDVIMRRETQQKVLQWRFDPLHSKAIPESWKCPGSETHLFAGESYPATVQIQKPLASNYSFLLPSPQAAKAFHIALDEYLGIHKIAGATIRSEREIIDGIIRAKSITQLVGNTISYIPIGLCGIFVLLVVQSVMVRKRKDLLLYLVMGASEKALLLQSILIAFLVLFPSMLFGYLIGSVLPQHFVSRLDFLKLPPDLVSSIQHATLSFSSFSFMLITTTVLAALMSLWSVRSIVSTDPSAIFRGGE